MFRGDPSSGSGDDVSKRRLSRTAPFSVASLFAGIGGFDLAFEAHGAKIAVQCELDPFCQAVLKRHWPEAKLLKDINKIVPAELAGTNLWTAGFPCQDVSLARGNHGRSGLKGTQTSLFFKLVELMERHQPEVLLLENVVGLLNSHKGCDFAIILRELTKNGYAVAWRVLNARYFGTPQSRSRVFMVAWKGNYVKALRSLFEDVPGAKVGSERAGFVTPTKQQSTGAIVPKVAYCVAATSGRHTGNDWARSYISYFDRVRRPTASESEKLQGFTPGWTIPQASYPVPIRGLDSERYRAVGNAVAVPVVKWIAGRVLAANGSQALRGEKTFQEDVTKLAPDLRQSTEILNFSNIMHEVDAGAFAYRWKGCGIAYGDNIVEGATAAAPAEVMTSQFVDLLDVQTPDDRYFLTANAAAGILRRADAVGRTLFAPMRAALERLVEEVTSTAAPSAQAYGDRSAKTSIRSASSGQCEFIERASASPVRAASATR